MTGAAEVEVAADADAVAVAVSNADVTGDQALLVAMVISFETAVDDVAVAVVDDGTAVNGSPLINNFVAEFVDVGQTDVPFVAVEIQVLVKTSLNVESDDLIYDVESDPTVEHEVAALTPVDQVLVVAGQPVQNLYIRYAWVTQLAGKPEPDQWKNVYHLHYDH